MKPNKEHKPYRLQGWRMGHRTDRRFYTLEAASEAAREFVAKYPEAGPRDHVGVSSS